MQTPSHLIMTAALRYPLRRAAIRLSTTGWLLGAVLPDLPFILLTIGYELFYRLRAIAVPAPTVMEYLHFDLFFNDPIWIVGHNTFHSLIVNGLLLIGSFFLWRSGRRWGAFLFWLALAMQLHTIVDIFTHSSDGPLFLFPLNWQYRFQSPISYWESGFAFTLFEYTLDTLLLIFLFRQWRHNRQPQKVAIR